MPQTVYAIGDIHGDLKQLQAILSFIREDINLQSVTDYHVIFIGDLVDRRADSKAVIDLILRGIERGEPWVVLRGNHDRLFAMFLRDPLDKDPILRPDYTWLHPRMGGRDTLQSYGVEYRDDKPLTQLHAEALAAVPAKHRTFLSNLPNTWETDTYFFCHAGVRPGTPLAAQTEDDLVWIRGPFHNWTDRFEKVIVHGHTPVDQVTNYGNRINIDTGAAWGEKLSAIVIDGNGAWQITARGRQDTRFLPPGNY